MTGRNISRIVAGLAVVFLLFAPGLMLIAIAQLAGRDYVAAALLTASAIAFGHLGVELVRLTRPPASDEIDSADGDGLTLDDPDPEPSTEIDQGRTSAHFSRG